MSTTIFDAGVIVTSFAGPQRSDLEPRVRLQFDPRGEFPRNTLNYSEVERLHKRLGNWLQQHSPHLGDEVDNDCMMVALGHGLHFNIVATGDGAEANLTRMPEADLDSGEALPGPDIMLMRWAGGTGEHVRQVAAKELRAMAQKIDGLPIVKMIEVRNEPASWELEAMAARSQAQQDDLGILVDATGDGLERFKVLVTLEDNEHVRRVVGSWLIEPMQQQINSGFNARYFATRNLDPVSERWRREAEAEIEQRDDDIDRRNS